jgi:hypothetical protein
MKAILTLFILVLYLGVTTSASADDSFVCIGSKITHFIYDKKTKECQSIIQESYNIYIVEKHKNTKHTWGLRKSGETYLCDEDSNESEYLLCDIIGDFKMFKRNLQFLNSYLEDSCYSTDIYGKVTGKAGRDESYIEIGRCHPL